MVAAKQDLDVAAAVAAVAPPLLAETLDLHHALARSVIFAACSARTGAGVPELVGLLGAALPFDS